MAAWDPAFDVVALVRQPPIETIEGVRYLDVKDSSDALWDSQPWTVVSAATHYGRGNRAAAKSLESNLIFPPRVLERAGPKVQHFVTLVTYYNNFEMPFADTSKLTDLGWKAKTSLLEGLAQTAAKMIKD